MEKSFDFATEALSTISYIADTIEDSDPAGLIDLDYLGDILKFTTPRGEYVINKHSAAKEIWVASPISGPYHFYYKNGEWINKNELRLFATLNEELGQFINIHL